tara:strand:+ start:13202 stop:15343 length:2142 start_codon:yes stop_codon:yes gene_type:complete
VRAKSNTTADDENVKRTTILNAIEYELRGGSVGVEEPRPLGEMVARVASQIRAEESFAITSRVIPVEQIAAFVDGSLTPQETSVICTAVKTDNSVLAELIAAVQAVRSPQGALPPVSDELQQRLMAMAPQPTTAQSVAVESDSAPIAESIIASSVQADGSEEGLLNTISAVADRQPADKDRSNDRTNRYTVVWAASALVVAAGLIAAIVWARKDDHQPVDGTQLVERDVDELDAVDSSMIPELPELEATIQDDQWVGVERQGEKEPLPIATEPDSTGLAKQDSRANDPDMHDPEIHNLEILPDVGESSIVKALEDSPAPLPSDRAPRLPNFKWTEISGLLTQQNLPSESASSDVTAHSWRGVSVSSPENPMGESADRFTVRTMPLSRAEADLGNGGKIVIGADTQLSMQRGRTRASADLQLSHGSVAAVDLPTGTVLQFARAGHPAVRLHWKSQATAVIERVDQALNVYVHQGTVMLNDRPVQKSAYTVRDEEPLREMESPKRLATWVNRPVETISIPRPVLAQIADSSNALLTLSDRINALSRMARPDVSDQRELATLARWQAAMADANLYRLAGSRVPAVRFAALERLVELPESDPRSDRLWRSIEQNVPNPQRVAQIRRWCMTVARGQRPPASEIENMTIGLGSTDISQRALCDYLLRRSVGGGPVFDPTWTGAAQLRGLNLWRTSLGLRVLNRSSLSSAAPNRGARPNP